MAGSYENASGGDLIIGGERFAPGDTVPISEKLAENKGVQVFIKDGALVKKAGRPPKAKAEE